MCSLALTHRSVPLNISGAVSCHSTVLGKQQHSSLSRSQGITGPALRNSIDSLLSEARVICITYSPLSASLPSLPLSLCLRLCLLGAVEAMLDGSTAALCRFPRPWSDFNCLGFMLGQALGFRLTAITPDTPEPEIKKQMPNGDRIQKTVKRKHYW
ncbi:hypothetical protein WMY93_005742 [Mugilogobius chulae]|uniref:Uncharacterized protein n=1 Tax=Mugilogobius chulae TaxID=88201 RepID=A0AAW0PHX3_9GOBI